MVKVSFFDKKLRSQYLNFLSLLSLVLSLILIFYSIPDGRKVVLAVLFVFMLLLVYMWIWIRANRLRETVVCVNTTEIKIKFGDIFSEAGLRVIPFNEYFDTQVDDKIIAQKTLNGVYLKNWVNDISALNSKILKETKGCPFKINKKRSAGKKIQYKLGTIVFHDGFLLTAFSRFDESNKAFLKMEDYLDFLLFFWEEIDRVYAGKGIVVPLLGSGMTRFKNNESITGQELLEMLVWSFKVSRVHFKYGAKITIVIDETKKDEINLFKLNGV